MSINVSTIFRTGQGRSDSYSPLPNAALTTWAQVRICRDVTRKPAPTGRRASCSSIRIRTRADSREGECMADSATTHLQTQFHRNQFQRIEKKQHPGIKMFFIGIALALTFHQGRIIPFLPVLYDMLKGDVLNKVIVQFDQQ